jgi:predicted metal-dependent enzyme (double-stranded beta helix superfamily)
VFDLDSFLAELVDSAAETDSRHAAKEVVEKAMARPRGVVDAISLTVGGISMLYHSPLLTVINVAWAPGMQVMPHDHRMWAIIGIYAGAEDNQFFTRGENDALVERSGRRLDTGEVCMLGSDTIHAVANTTDRLTGAVHVYGGDFVNQSRSQWGPGDLVERPYDMADISRQFHEANLAAGLVES